MVCLYCNSPTRVMNSRPQKRTNSIWRRRQCLKCKAVFTTEESPTFSGSILVNSPSASQPFSRDQLFVSIYESCKHRKDAQTVASALTDTIIGKLLPQVSDAAIERAQIVTTASMVLGRFDKAAGVHYAAYHPL